MQQFSAVVTTGIYCRPGCSAQPLPRNVRPFPTAAAAEAAGFRACLRCRPYRWTATADWTGPELVCRAVQLVIDGALDEGTEAALGRRVGVSARHLRRLFVTHLGATPDQLARSRRVHFARRLLDDTDLTITDIAYAAGFGSTRQLNRACRDVFRATPRELRARRRAGDLLTADGGLALRMPFEGSLAWDAMLGYLGARAIGGVESVAGGTYRRTVVVAGDPAVLEILPGGSDHLILRAHLPHWEGLIHVVERARRIFALDVDPKPAFEHLRRDTVIGPLVAARAGLRVPGTWDPFEIGVRAIVGQQVSVAAANTVIGRVVARHGVPVPGITHLGLTHTFPSPSALADADLESCGLMRTRADAVRGFARSVAGHAVVLDGSRSLDDLVAGLAEQPGLGTWTAHYIALRLGEPDAFPASDLGLRRAAAALTDVPLATVAERWKPWRASAAIHLWLASAGREQVAPAAARRTG